MTTIPSPYAVSADPAARRWWDGLSEASQREFARSWQRDDRDDPLKTTARRVAGFLNQCLVERDATERAWESLDFYENLVSNDVRELEDCYRIGSFWNNRDLLDHGMFWPTHRPTGRIEIDPDRCSREQKALLAMHQASG
ncbi:MAG: hypothetical protein ACREP7_00360 [Lysobacter sp.]